MKIPANISKGRELNESGAESAPLVSVVITTYNRPNYLRYALKSAVQQTYPHLDVIVSDNQSDPEHYATIQHIVDTFDDDRIRLVQRTENVGLQHNNVWALRDAPGTYVANLHDDDIWEPTFVEQMVEALEAHPESTMAFCDHYLIDASGDILEQRTNENSEYWGRTSLDEGLHQPFARIGLIDRSIPGVMGAMYRHDAIDWEAIPMPATAYDLWLIYLACRDGSPAYYISDRLTRYRVHEGSQTARGLFRLHYDLTYCYESFAADPRLTYLEPELRRKASEYHCSIAATFLRASMAGRARRHFDRAIELSYNPRSMFGWLLARLPSELSQNILYFRRHTFQSYPEVSPEDLSSPEIVQAALKLTKSGTVNSTL